MMAEEPALMVVPSVEYSMDCSPDAGSTRKTSTGDFFSGFFACFISFRGFTCPGVSSWPLYILILSLPFNFLISPTGISPSLDIWYT